MGGLSTFKVKKGETQNLFSPPPPSAIIEIIWASNEDTQRNAKSKNEEIEIAPPPLIH